MSKDDPNGVYGTYYNIACDRELCHYCTIGSTERFTIKGMCKPAKKYGPIDYQ